MAATLQAPTQVTVALSSAPQLPLSLRVLANPGADGCLPFSDAQQVGQLAWDTLTSRLPAVGVGVPFAFANGDANSTVAGKVVRLHTDGKCYLAQANSLAHATRVFGVWFDAGKAQNEIGRVYTRGDCPVLLPFTGSPAIGPCFLDPTTAGNATSTAPNGTFWPRYLGEVVAVQSPTTAWVMLNIPSDTDANEREWTIFSHTLTAQEVTSSLVIPVVHFAKRFTISAVFAAAPSAPFIYDLMVDGSYQPAVTQWDALLIVPNAVAAVALGTEARFALGSTSGLCYACVDARRINDTQWYVMSDCRTPASGTYAGARFHGVVVHPSASLGIATVGNIPAGSFIAVKGC
jgi:hypothetical protein